jgi:hypothetical protein
MSSTVWQREFIAFALPTRVSFLTLDLPIAIRFSSGRAGRLWPGNKCDGLAFGAHRLSF